MANTINYDNYPPIMHYMGREYMGGEAVMGNIGQSSLYNIIITEGKSATYSTIEREENV